MSERIYVLLKLLLGSPLPRTVGAPVEVLARTLAAVHTDCASHCHHVDAAATGRDVKMAAHDARVLLDSPVVVAGLVRCATDDIVAWLAPRASAAGAPVVHESAHPYADNVDSGYVHVHCAGAAGIVRLRVVNTF